MCACVVFECVCDDVQRCVWWNLHHTNSERLKLWLVSDMKRAATHKRAPVHLGPQRLHRAISRRDVPSWHLTLNTSLVLTSTCMVLRQTVHGPTLHQTSSD